MANPALDRPSTHQPGHDQQMSDNWAVSALSSVYEGIKKTVQNPYVDGVAIGVLTAAAFVATRGRLGVVARVLPDAEALLPKAGASFDVARASLGSGESQLSLGAPFTEVNWAEALDTLKTQGESPATAVGRAARTSRVVGLGEIHAPPGERLDQIRDHTANLMPTLRVNGITHLGVELPTVTKPIFDAFNAGKNQLEIPALLSGDGGDDALRVLYGLKTRNPQLISAWMRARDVGIRVVPLDVNGVVTLGNHSTDVAREMFIRDNAVDVLSGNPENKLFAWLGNMHMADSRGAAGIKSAAELLREDIMARGEKLTTFGSVIDHWGDRTVFQTASTPLTHAVQEATSIATTNADGSLNGIGKIPLQKLKIDWGRHHFPEQPFDNLIIHPSPVRAKIVGADDLRKLEGDYFEKLLPKSGAMPKMRMPKSSLVPGQVGHKVIPTESPRSAATEPLGRAAGAGADPAALATRLAGRAGVSSTIEKSVVPAEGQAIKGLPADRMRHATYYSSEVNRLVPGDEELKDASYRYMMHQAGVDNYASSLADDLKLIEGRSGLKELLDKLVTKNSELGKK